VIFSHKPSIFFSLQVNCLVKNGSLIGLMYLIKGVVNPLLNVHSHKAFYSLIGWGLCVQIGGWLLSNFGLLESLELSTDPSVLLVSFLHLNACFIDNILVETGSTEDCFTKSSSSLNRCSLGKTDSRILHSTVSIVTGCHKKSTHHP